MYWLAENELGKDVEMELEIYFTPYVPAKRPTYSCGGLPAEEAEFIIEGASIYGINGSFIELCEGHRLIPNEETVIETLEEECDGNY